MQVDAQKDDGRTETNVERVEPRKAVTNPLPFAYGLLRVCVSDSEWFVDTSEAKPVIVRKFEGTNGTVVSYIRLGGGWAASFGYYRDPATPIKLASLIPVPELNDELDGILQVAER